MKAFKYVGCYLDNSPEKDLGGSMKPFKPDKNTIEADGIIPACIARCKNKSFTYASVENG